MIRRSSKLRSKCTVENLRNRFDSYGQSFYLSFKGEATFNTNLGAIVSVLVYMFFLIYVCFRGYILVTKSETSTVTNQFVEKINYTNPELINYDDYKFDIAFQIIPPISPEYGTFVPTHQQKVKNSETGEVTQIITNLEYGECGTDSLNYDDQGELLLKNFDKYYCLKNLTKNDTVLGGTLYAVEFNSFSLSFTRCVNSTESSIICASKEAQDAVHRHSFIQLVLVDSYFDYNDLAVPVKSYLEQRNFYYLDSDYLTYGILQLIPSEATTQQSILPLQPPEEYHFAKLSSILSQKIAMTETDETKFNLLIRLSNQKVEITRQIYSLMDFLSDIGGLFSAFFVAGKIVVGVYLEQLYYSHIISQLFHIDLKDETAGPGEKGRRSKLERQETVRKYLKQSSINQEDSEEFHNQLTNEILARRSFQFSFHDIISRQLFYLKRYSLYCCCKQKPKVLAQKRKQMLFEKAMRRVENEFDAINLFAVMKQCKILSKIVFSQPQEFVLQFQRNQVLNSESSDAGEDFFENVEFLNSKNPYARLKFVSKIKKYTKNFLTRGKRKGLDKRLLKGVFCKASKGGVLPEEGSKRNLLREVVSFFHNKDNKVTPESKTFLENEGEESKRDLSWFLEKQDQSKEQPSAVANEMDDLSFDFRSKDEQRKNLKF